MKERPIPFSALMVLAIMAGTKTQTRRAIKLKPWHTIEERDDGHQWPWMLDGERDADYWLPCPYGKPSDRLWVREAWRAERQFDGVPPRDIPSTSVVGLEAARHWWPDPGKFGKPRPGMFMPRWASRITLEVTGVRVERLQDISEADALAEGIVATRDGYGLPDGEHFHAADPRQSYFSLWEAINGPGSVEANPWLWAVSFKHVEANYG